MSEKGSLAKIHFSKLIVWIHERKLSGTLRLIRDDMSKYVLLEKGEFMSAYSDFPEDGFRAVIRRMRLLPESQQMELELENEMSDGAFAKRLIEKGYVTEREFLEVLKRQNEDILLSLFEWRKGDFILYENKFPEKKAITLKQPFDTLLEKGIERYHQRLKIDALVPSSAVFKVKDDDFRAIQVLEHPQFEVREVFRALDEPRKIREIAAESSLTEFQIVSVLYRFIESGDIDYFTSTEGELPPEIKKALATAEILFSRKRYWEAWTRVRKLAIENPEIKKIQEYNREYARKFKEELKKTIESVHMVPEVVGSIDDTTFKKFPKDSALGFLLSRIDGKSTIADLGKLLQIDREKLLLTLYILIQSGTVKLTRKKGPVSRNVVERRKFVRKIWEKIEHQNYYEILGVTPTATPSEIKVAYFNLAKLYHPDARPEDDPDDVREKLDEIFVKIRNAYHVLIDKQKREEYDNRVIRRQVVSSKEEMKIRTKAQLQFSVGLRALQSREYRTAMEYFRSAIDLDPYESKYYGKLAEVCTRNPRWYRAGILSSLKAIELDPEEPTYYATLGMLYRLDGNYMEAEKQFLKVLQLDPENLTARKEMKLMGKEIPREFQKAPRELKNTPMLKKKKRD